MRAMSISLRFICVSICAASLAACGGGNDDNAASAATRVAVALEAPGSNCTTGGSKIAAGIDIDHDGVLSAAEVLTTQYVCNGQTGSSGLSGATGLSGAAGLDALVSMTNEEAGMNCPAGGQRVDVGLDANRNGVLDASEISSSSYVCHGVDGAGSSGGNGMTSLLAIAAEPAGAHCGYGGSKLTSGLDRNGNGTLDAAEVSATSYLCRSVATLVAVDVEPAGAHCASGGSRITAGLDTNGSGTLDVAEVTSTQYACNGASGAAGSTGASGLNALVTTAAEAAGANCSSGGRKVSVGLDSNRNGVLDAAEVSSSSYVCNGFSGANGTNGTNGTNGAASMISITVEPVGANCAAGGNKILSGVDANGNGVLDPAEITTSYVCNGAAGPSLPMIQSLATHGLPAAPGGTVYITTTAQSATGSALSYRWMVSTGWSVIGAADTNLLTLSAPAGYASIGAATVHVTDSSGMEAVGTVGLTTVGDPGPTIQGVAVYPQPVITGANLLVSATHPFGAALTTDWTIGGIAHLLSGASAYWRSPGIAGTYLVEPTVGDGTTSVTSTVPMVVGSPSAWPKFRNNLQANGVSPISVADTTGSLKWSVAATQVIWSSPAIAPDGTVYFGSNDFNLYAVNPDGSSKWTFATGGIIHSSPAVAADGTIYFASWDLNTYALDPDGNEKWRFAIDVSTQSSPAIGADGTVYMATSRTFYAIAPDGSLKWSVPIGSQSSPAIGADGSIYFIGAPPVSGASISLYALNPDGTTRHATFLGLTGASYSSPAIAADGTAYFGWGPNVFAIDPNNGNFKGSLGLGDDVYSSPAIGDDGTVYVGALDGKIYALHPDCSVKWTVTTGATVYSSPSIAGDGTILIGSQDGKLYALNPNGSTKWTYQASGAIKYSSPAIAADGTIYVGTYDNKLLAVH